MRVAMMDFTNDEARSVSTLDAVLMPAQHGALSGLTNVTQINQAWFQERLFNLVLMPDNGVLENQEVAWAAHVMWIQPT